MQSPSGIGGVPERLGNRSLWLVVHFCRVSMRVRIDTSGLKATNWHQLLLRFGFGGLVTAAAGVIAKIYGPAVGGLFLAFPAIFPATATLIEKHERERKQKAGLQGAVRARKAVAIDAAGASMGAIGLLAFALVV